MSCEKLIFGFIKAENHCEHSQILKIKNTHGKFYQVKNYELERDGFVCCKCGRERLAGYYELADA